MRPFRRRAEVASTAIQINLTRKRIQSPRSLAWVTGSADSWLKLLLQMSECFCQVGIYVEACPPSFQTAFDTKKFRPLARAALVTSKIAHSIAADHEHPPTNSRRRR
jgi:hypothetical protein